MFTGLIEHRAEVLANNPIAEGRRLIIRSPWPAVESGESIAVNGVCLTRLPCPDTELRFDLSPETLYRTTLGQLKKGDEVNLERAMTAHTRFGGHYVSGHVDTTACLSKKTCVGDYLELVVDDFSVNAGLYLLPKGSITLDGISLTINQVEKGSIQLMIVPHTLVVTTLKQTEIGHRFNVEFDYLTRIVAHQLNISGQLKNEVYS
ncbi:riboflavin synthase [Legionella spiritensis]|uniref:riboflavin synthase n=1 Tax=Legionella spiritensis TaxID=452 RepID=UPI000F6B82C3|nr:riboflavin synthase [Legionella spiritensis]VEG90479.1 riboflavin synthase alpha chain [Legionella spiritensis]